MELLSYSRAYSFKCFLCSVSHIGHTDDLCDLYDLYDLYDIFPPGDLDLSGQINP